MKWNRGLLGSIQEAALVGGRLPVWWQSEIERSTVRLNDLKRACVWVESWEIAIRAMLRHEPLLGHSLAELTDRVARRAGLKPDVPRSERPQPARPEYRRTRDREEALTDEGPANVSPSRGPVPMQEGGQVSEETPHQSRPDPFQLEPHASAELYPETRRDWLHDLGRWADCSLGQCGLDVFRTPQQASPVQQDIGETALLGHSLAELTGLVTGPAGSKPEKTRPRQPRFAWPEYRDARDQEMVQASKRWAKVSPSGSSVTMQQGDQVWEKTPGPIQLASQASQALLNRLAGATAAAQGSYGTRRQPTSEPMKPKAGPSPSVLRAPAYHRDWLRDLAKRVRGSLLQEEHDELSAPLHTSSTSQPRLGETVSLADQWALPLNGPPASEDLLGRLVSVRADEGDGSDRKVHHNAVPGGPSAIGSPDQLAASATDHTGLWHMLGAKATGNSQAGIQPTVADMENMGGESESPFRIAPPAVATSLPPLVSPQVADKPPSPAATAIVLGAARNEEAAATEDDLSALAAKIKRILDEEARRHGIDV